jgi:hypothetical protein
MSLGYGTLSFNQFTGVSEYALPVPGNTIGMIIGNKGSTINLIKRNSGAHVQIQQPQPMAGRPHSWFMITGFPHQIKAAYDFMANIIKNATERDQARFHSQPVVHPPTESYQTAFPTLPNHATPTAQPTQQEIDADHDEFFTQQERDNQTEASLAADLDEANTELAVAFLLGEELIDLAVDLVEGAAHMDEFFDQCDRDLAAEEALRQELDTEERDMDNIWIHTDFQYINDPMDQWIIEDQKHTIRATAGMAFGEHPKYSDENLEYSIKHFNDTGMYFTPTFDAEGNPVAAY